VKHQSLTPATQWLRQHDIPFEEKSYEYVEHGGTALAGGTGSGIRTVLGVLLIILLSNCMNMLGVSTYLQTIMKGLVLVIAIWLDNRKEQQIH